MNERVRAIRSELRMTRAAFGALIGITGDMVNNIERGRVSLKEQTIKVICSECGVNEEWLRYGTGLMFKPTPTEALDALLEEYNLTRQDYALIQKFVSAPPEVRGILESFIVETAAAIRRAGQPAPAETVILNAAHERTDRECSDEDRAHDNALLDNWEGNE